MVNTKLKTIIISLLVILVLVLIGSYHGRKFRANHLLTIGKIVGYDKGCGTKGVYGQNLHYEYYADGKLLHDSRQTSQLPCDIGEHIIGKTFPVAYRKYWYGYENNILMIPEDFKLYGHPFPDSLKWMLQYDESNK